MPDGDQRGLCRAVRLQARQAVPGQLLALAKPKDPVPEEQPPPAHRDKSSIHADSHFDAATEWHLPIE